MAAVQTAQSGAQPRPNKLAHIKRDRGYRFSDRDPVLVRITEAITRSGWELDFLHERSGVSVGTLRKWMNGDTRSPYNKTVDAVFFALGYDRITVPVGQGKSRRQD